MLAASAVALLGCDSSDFADLDFDNHYFQNDYRVTNMAGQEIDLYIVNSSSAGNPKDPFKNQFRKVAQLADGQTKQITHERNAISYINIGAKLSFADDEKHVRNEYKVTFKGDYHIVVWQQQNSLEHRLIRRKNTERSAQINVRVLSLSSSGMLITADGEITINRGEISQQIGIENCANSLYFNALALDLCDADYGRSYLLLVSGEKIQLIPEK